MANKWTPQKRARVSDDFIGMSDNDLVAVIEEQLLLRPKLAPVRARVVECLHFALTSAETRGGVIDADFDSVTSEGVSEQEVDELPNVVAVNDPKPEMPAGARTAAQIVAKAREAILAEEMLETKELVGHLAAPTSEDRASWRKKIDQMQRASALIALPDDRDRVLYPAFQVDPKEHRIHPEVEKVNVILGAAGDPWGVASWWLSPHARIGASPMSLLGTSNSHQLIALAESLFDDGY